MNQPRRGNFHSEHYQLGMVSVLQRRPLPFRALPAWHGLRVTEKTTSIQSTTSLAWSPCYREDHFHSEHYQLGMVSVLQRRPLPFRALPAWHGLRVTEKTTSIQSTTSLTWSPCYREDHFHSEHYQLGMVSVLQRRPLPFRALPAWHGLRVTEKTTSIQSTTSLAWSPCYREDHFHSEHYQLGMDSVLQRRPLLFRALPAWHGLRVTEKTTSIQSTTSLAWSPCYREDHFHSEHYQLGMVSVLQRRPLPFRALPAWHGLRVTEKTTSIQSTTSLAWSPCYREDHFHSEHYQLGMVSVLQRRPLPFRALPAWHGLRVTEKTTSIQSTTSLAWSPCYREDHFHSEHYQLGMVSVLQRRPLPFRALPAWHGLRVTEKTTSIQSTTSLAWSPCYREDHFHSEHYQLGMVSVLQRRPLPQSR